MERAIWKGHITFGLINIPVTLFSAEKSTHLHFHLLDSRNKARVRYERINDETGEEVPWNKLVKAFEYQKGNYVILKEEELKTVAVDASQTIDLLNFVDAKSISYVYFDKPYYLLPEKKAEKGYVLLRDALKKTNKIGVAKVVIRTRQYLAALLPCKNALLLSLLRYQDEIKPASQFDFPKQELTDFKIRDEEIKLSEQLIEAMTSVWDPGSYQDDYREAVMKLIEEKVKHEQITKPKTKSKAVQSSDNVIDFISAIKQSLETKKQTRKAKSPTARPPKASKSKPTKKVRS